MPLPLESTNNASEERYDYENQKNAYWTTTAIVAFLIGSGGAAELAHMRGNVEGLMRLGYPAYFVTIIGFWKVLGAVALLAPRFPRLKEWAYAGIFFNMTGAAVSALATGAAAWHVLVDVILTVLVLTSWALRPQSRMLGKMFSVSRTRASESSAVFAAASS